MTDKPILFQGNMVRGILRNGKTQTRRILNPQPRIEFPNSVIVDKIRITENSPVAMFRNRTGIRQDIKLKYALGDRLWLRESWWTKCSYDDLAPRDVPETAPISYAATDLRKFSSGVGRPSIFMMKWSSRITLPVVDVRVQRLQDCSEQDAIAEGVIKAQFSVHGPRHTVPRYFIEGRKDDCHFKSAVDAYKSLWNSINGKPKPKMKDGKIDHYLSFPWDGDSGTFEHLGKPHIVTANPWVSATTFVIIKTNINKIGENHG